MPEETPEMRHYREWEAARAARRAQGEPNRLPRVEPAPPICINCTYCNESFNCTRERPCNDVVRGPRTVNAAIDCYAERSRSTQDGILWCGPSGRFFEQRTTVHPSLAIRQGLNDEGRAAPAVNILNQVYPPGYPAHTQTQLPAGPDYGQGQQRAQRQRPVGEHEPEDR